jgi:pilus assembly protein CpaB
MSAVRYVILGVAAASAVGLAVVVRSALGDKPEAQAAAAVQRAEPTVKVLVAARDLKVGERLSTADLTWQEWPAKAVNPSFVVDGQVPEGVQTIAATASAAQKAAAEKAAEDAGETSKKGDAADKAMAKAQELLTGASAKQAFVDAIVREPVLAGEPIQDRKLVRAGESGFMAVVLAPGMRAMAVPVKVQTAAGGFILPGDRVDVIVSRTVKIDEEDQIVSQTVMRNIRVLAVDQTTEPAADAQAVVGATATLEVASRDSESLALAAAQGELSLVLRSYADVNDPSGAVPRRAFAPGASKVAAAPDPSGAQPGGIVVRLYRGGEATQVQVSR